MNPTPQSATAALDWQQAHARLARAARALREALDPTPERQRALLQERARALARPAAEKPAASDLLHLVTFALGAERYALEACHVREVVRFTEYTPVPGTPPFLVGVCNLRGEILAVIDLRHFFGIAVRGVTDLSRILVLGGDRAEFGVLADAAHEVVAVRTADVLEPPATVAGIGREYLRGVTGDALIVLDGGVLLQDRRLFNDQAETPGGER
jgi:purine-binding chemotaxis protein CheW